jgi:hypothetical protein
LAASALRRAWIIKTTTCVVTTVHSQARDLLTPSRQPVSSACDGLLLDVAPRILDRLSMAALADFDINDRADRHFTVRKSPHQLRDGAWSVGKPHQDRDDGIHGRAKCARGDAY